MSFSSMPAVISSRAKIRTSFATQTSPRSSRLGEHGRLRRTLPADDRRALIRDLTLAPEWMRRSLKELAPS
jgi:hypothetical protein